MELLARLFGSGARIKTLRLFMFNKDGAFTAAEIAGRTKLSKEVVRREITELTAAGLLRKKGVQTPSRYQTNPRFEHLGALDVFIRETTSVRPKHMVSSLKRAGTLRLVALSGLFTGVEQTQIDLLIVGDNLEERVLANAVHTL